MNGDDIICLYLHYLDIEDCSSGKSPYFVEASNGVNGWFVVGGVRCDGVMATVLFGERCTYSFRLHEISWRRLSCRVCHDDGLQYAKECIVLVELYRNSCSTEVRTLTTVCSDVDVVINELKGRFK